MPPYPPWARTGPAHWSGPVPPERAARRSLRARWFAAALSALVQLPGLAFALAGAAQLHHASFGDGYFTGHSAFDSGLPSGDLLTVLAALSGIVAAGLLLLPSPGPRVVAVGVLALPAVAFAPGPPLAALAVAFAVATAVLRRASIWAWATLIGMGVVGVVAIVIAGGGSGGIRVLIATIILCLIAGVATGAGARRERFRAAAREETSRRRSAAEEERLRIARELHDVLAHSLSQISVQAGVGLHLFDEEPERAKESLRSIRETSTMALDEVRSVLGILREPDAPAAPRAPGPTLDALPALIASVRAAGLEVTTTGIDQPRDVEVPLAVQSAAYRIVQESLTNVQRHGGVSAAAVRLDITSDAVGIVVENGPGGHPASSSAGERMSDGGGRGVLGMQERAAALGGSVDARLRADGGFVVTARLPLRPDQPGRGGRR